MQNLENQYNCLPNNKR